MNLETGNWKITDSEFPARFAFFEKYPQLTVYFILESMHHTVCVRVPVFYCQTDLQNNLCKINVYPPQISCFFLDCGNFCTTDGKLTVETLIWLISNYEDTRLHVAIHCNLQTCVFIIGYILISDFLFPKCYDLLLHSNFSFGWCLTLYAEPRMY